MKSFMRALRKPLAGVVTEEGNSRSVYLPGLAHGSNPHMETGFYPFLLAHGREAVLPVQRDSDEQRLDGRSTLWLYRLRRAPLDTYAQMREEARGRTLPNESSARISE